jgi:hypothetical protein
MARDARPTLNLPARERVIDIPTRRQPGLLPGRALPGKAPVPIRSGGVTMMPGRPVLPRQPIKNQPNLPVRPGLGGGGIGNLTAGMPFHLTAGLTLRSGAVASPNLQSLRAPNGQGLLIEEVTFEIGYFLSDGNPYMGSTMNMGSLIGCQMQLGAEPLTAGFVPLAMFGPTLSTVSEYQTIDDDIGFLSIFTWRPPVPIYVPPGQLLEPTFVHFGLYNAVLQVKVSYSGIAGQRPQQKALPYVMHWAADAFLANGTEVERVCNEKDLANPFNVPFHVKTVLGRVYGLFQDIAQAKQYLTEGGVDTATYPHNDIYVSTKVQLLGSWGTPVVRDYTPWPQIFDPWTRQLEVAHEMPPESYYLAGVKGGSIADAAYDGQGLARISLVGWREV